MEEAKLKEFRLKIGKYRIDYDKDYGFAHQTGWSLAVDGSYVVQFVTLRGLIHELIWRKE